MAVSTPANGYHNAASKAKRAARLAGRIPIPGAKDRDGVSANETARFMRLRWLCRSALFERNARLLEITAAKLNAQLPQVSCHLGDIEPCPLLEAFPADQMPQLVVASTHGGYRIVPTK